MRTKLFICLLCLTVQAVIAQNVPVKKTATITENEVPAAVRSSFEKDFGIVPAGGIWAVHFSTTQQEGKAVATPLWYTFSKREEGGKLEVKYFPTGKLKSYKGLEKKQDVANSGATF